MVKKTCMAKFVKTKENVICMAKGSKTRETQTCIQVVKVEMEWFGDLSSKMAETPKFQ